MTHAAHLPVAILAGGLARRLHPITEKIPKVLVPVAGRPFLAHQLELLCKQGIKKAVLCLGHLGEQVVDKFGDGSKYGMELDYSFDGPDLLGTGGAIKKALPLLGESFFVLYGDSYLIADFQAVARSFEASRKQGLMTVYRNADAHDKSNVVFSEGRIVLYDKKQAAPEMAYIDYGLSLFKKMVFEQLSINRPCDLSEIFQVLITNGQLAGHEVATRFYEVGSHSGLQELDQLLKKA